MSSTIVSGKSSEVKQKERYNDNIIAMTFVKKYDTPGMQGMFSMDIKFTNKSNQEITVYPQDVYVNDTMVTVGSGTPLDLLSGKNKIQSFFGKYEGTGITAADKIKKLGLKISVMDKSSMVIETTKAIEINF